MPLFLIVDRRPTAINHGESTVLSFAISVCIFALISIDKIIYHQHKI